MQSEKDVAKKEIALVEKYLKLGYHPSGARGFHARGALAAASAELNVDRVTFRAKVGTPAEPGSYWRKFALAPRWDLFKEKKQKEFAPTDIPAEAEGRRLRDELNRTKSSRDEALRAASAATGFRKSVLGLKGDMPEPAVFKTSVQGERKPETIILMATDWQWGESVSLERMDGVNSYGVAIARSRAQRLFATTVALATEHWTGPPPARLILILGGDMISGEIHEELAKTNELLAIPALKDCAGALMGGINLLLKELKCPIDVICIPGNHGRVTRKPESKLYVETSYDTLLGDILDLHYRDEKRVTFYAPASGDALFNVDGWTFLVTHGDRIGSRGGQGFIGPAGTVARGFKRLISDYAGRGTIIDYILCGHFHTALRLEEGFVSGTLVGSSEYARDGRFRPAPASQLFLTVHQRRGVTQYREIYVGAEGEGSLYAGRAPAGEKPRYRVKAIRAPVERNG